MEPKRQQNMYAYEFEQQLLQLYLNGKSKPTNKM